MLFLQNWMKILNYNISADIIRILAVFFVVFSHTTDRFVIYTILKGGISWDIIYYFNTLSRVAVPLFIMLSGYLLLHREKTKNIERFYKRRFTKIFVPFLVWLSIYFMSSADWNIARLTPQYVFTHLWEGNIWHLYFIIIILELYVLAPLLVHIIETNSRKKQTILFWLLITFSIFCSLLNIWHVNLRNNSLTMFIPYIGIFYAGAYLRSLRVEKLLTGTPYNKTSF